MNSSDYLLLAIAVLLLGGCAATSAPVDCGPHAAYRTPANYEAFGAPLGLPPLPAACLPMARTGRGGPIPGLESVAVYSVETGTVTHVLLPAGARVVQ